MSRSEKIERGVDVLTVTDACAASTSRPVAKMNVETQRPVISCTHVGFNNSSATAATRRRGGSRDDDDSFNGVTTLVLHRGGGRRQILASYCEDDSLGGHQLED